MKFFQIMKTSGFKMVIIVIWHKNVFLFLRGLRRIFQRNKTFCITNLLHHILFYNLAKEIKNF